MVAIQARARAAAIQIQRPFGAVASPRRVLGGIVGVSIAFSGPVFLALCTGTAEGVTGALVLASTQAPLRLVLAAVALHLPASTDGVKEGGRAAATLWLMASLALVALPGFGAFAGAFLAGVAIAGVWPVHGLLVLAALGLATGAQLAPYARLREGSAGAGLGRGLRLVGAVALFLALVAGLRPGPLVELIRPAVSAVIGVPAAAQSRGLEPEAVESGEAGGGH